MIDAMSAKKYYHFIRWALLGELAPLGLASCLPPSSALQRHAAGSRAMASRGQVGGAALLPAVVGAAGPCMRSRPNRPLVPAPLRRLMGRAASHVTLECALQTHPQMALICEEVAAHRWGLKDVVRQVGGPPGGG